MFVTLVEGQVHRRAVEVHGKRRFVRVVHAETHDDLCDCVAIEATSAAIVDLDLCPSGGSREIARALRARRDPLALHFIHSLSPRALRELPLIASFDLDAKLFYRRRGELEAHLEGRSPEGVESATMEILRQIEPLLNDDFAPVFICCLVLGERRAKKKRVALELGFSLREINARLARVGILDFDNFIAILRLTHAIYRIDKCDLSPGVAAECAGFAGPRSLENFAKANTGFTPTQLVERGGFKLMMGMVQAFFTAASS